MIVITIVIAVPSIVEGGANQVEAINGSSVIRSCSTAAFYSPLRSVRFNFGKFGTKLRRLKTNKEDKQSSITNSNKKCGMIQILIITAL